MSILENLKLDKWYAVVLYLGVLLIAASLFYEVDFLQEKHLFGFGLGAVLIGLSYWIAEKDESTIKPPNVYSGPAAFITWKVIKHNPFTYILLIIGGGLVSFFGYRLIESLI